MDITDIQIKKVEGEGKLRAYASVTFDDLFVVHNIRVIEGDHGLFIGMPSRKTKSGEFKDVAHPIRQEFRKKLEEAVLAAYHKAAG